MAFQIRDRDKPQGGVRPHILRYRYRARETVMGFAPKTSVYCTQRMWQQWLGKTASRRAPVHPNLLSAIHQRSQVTEPWKHDSSSFLCLDICAPGKRILQLSFAKLWKLELIWITILWKRVLQTMSFFLLMLVWVSASIPISVTVSRSISHCN